MSGRADNTIRQVSTLQALDLPELNRILRLIQGDIAALQGKQGVSELRDARSILPPPLDPPTSKQDTATIFYDIKETKLRASENTTLFGDALNAAGAWISENSIGNGAGPLTWTEELTSDNATMKWDNNMTVSLLRKGIFLISYRASAITDLSGQLQLDLFVGDSVYSSLFTSLTGGAVFQHTDTITYVNTSEVPVDITLSISIGDTLGSIEPEHTILSIVKVR